MTQEWPAWLLSARAGGWPRTVGELMAGELASACLAVDNDPAARHPLDAEGHLTLDRLDAVLDALGALGRSDPWLAAWWDGWKGVPEAVGAAFGDRMFALELPRKGFTLSASLAPGGTTCSG